MSDRNYTPYGVDDDPFLTPPAGPGQADARFRQADYWASDAVPDQKYAAEYDHGQSRDGRYAPQSARQYQGFAPQQTAKPPQNQLHYGTPQHGEPQYDAQQYGAPQYGERRYSQPQYHGETHLDAQGAAQSYTGQDYAGQSYAGQDYAGQDYAGQHYTGLGYTGQHDTGQDYTVLGYTAQAGQPPVYRPEPTARPAFGNYPTAPQTPEAQYRAPEPNLPPHAAPAHAAPEQAARAQTALQNGNFRVRAVPSFSAPPRGQYVPPPAPLYAEPPAPLYAEPRAYARAEHPAHAAPHQPPQGYSAEINPFGPSTHHLVQWAGALCTALVVAGASYWGYALAVRDAHGIPVVRAAEGPLRIAPELPGGNVSANQGLSVNAIPAAGIALPAADQITLAPQAADLAPQDTLIVEEGSFAQTAGAGTAAGLAGASDQVLSAPQTGGGLATDLAALPDALPEDLPISDAEAVERALEMALAEGEDAGAGLAMEGEAIVDPIDLVSMSNADPVAPPTAEMDIAAIALGTPMAQLGAFDTAETARAEWAMLQTRFTELMVNKALVIEPAKSGGRDFYRLRAHGFASQDDSRRFCAAILAENGSCFPVDQR